MPFYETTLFPSFEFSHSLFSADDNISKCVFPSDCAMRIGMHWLVRLVQKQGGKGSEG